MPGCGWCDVNQLCSPGDAAGPATDYVGGDCHAWFYDVCVSYAPPSSLWGGGTPACSKQVMGEDCVRMCADRGNSSVSCRLCRGITAECFVARSGSGVGGVGYCPALNQTACPGGIPPADPNDAVVQLKPNVTSISPTLLDTVFECPGFDIAVPPWYSPPVTLTVPGIVVVNGGPFKLTSGRSVGPFVLYHQVPVDFDAVFAFIDVAEVSMWAACFVIDCVFYTIASALITPLAMVCRGCQARFEGDGSDGVLDHAPYDTAWTAHALLPAGTQWFKCGSDPVTVSTQVVTGDGQVPCKSCRATDLSLPH